MTISQPRSGLFEVCKKPSSRSVLCYRTTSCPPQPQLESIRKPLVLTKLELFLGEDPFTKVVIHDPWNTVTCLSEGQVGSRAFIFHISYLIYEYLKPGLKNRVLVYARFRVFRGFGSKKFRRLISLKLDFT